MAKRQMIPLNVLRIILSIALVGPAHILSAGEQRYSEGPDRLQTHDPFAKALLDLEMVNTKALRRAIRDLTKTFPAEYNKGAG
ncbi:MAG: hypothetical protein JSU70_03920, partial [Phycisphaerales bacterium]